MSAIETSYAGHLFRSRLEARWAALFDLLGWNWTYEPFDADGYIPDFLVRGDQPVLVEVRPCITEGEYEAESRKVRSKLGTRWGPEKHVVVVGVSPETCFADDNIHWGPSGGLYSGPNDWGSGSGGVCWITCLACSQPAWSHREGAYQSLPCGHWDGDHYLGEPPSIRQLWGEAHRQTRWTTR